MKMIKRIKIIELTFLFVLVSFFLIGCQSDIWKVDKTITPENFKVAFIADQDINDNSRAVLQLIKDEKASMVLHQGLHGK